MQQRAKSLNVYLSLFYLFVCAFCCFLFCFKFLIFIFFCRDAVEFTMEGLDLHGQSIPIETSQSKAVVKIVSVLFCVWCYRKVEESWLSDLQIFNLHYQVPPAVCSTYELMFQKMRKKYSKAFEKYYFQFYRENFVHSIVLKSCVLQSESLDLAFLYLLVGFVNDNIIVPLSLLLLVLSYYVECTHTKIKYLKFT